MHAPRGIIVDGLDPHDGVLSFDEDTSGQGGVVLNINTQDGKDGAGIVLNRKGVADLITMLVETLA